MEKRIFIKKLTPAEIGVTKTHEKYIRMPNEFDYAGFFGQEAKPNGTVLQINFDATYNNNDNEVYHLKFIYYINSNKEKRIPSLGILFDKHNVKVDDIICLTSTTEGEIIKYDISFKKSDEMDIYTSPIYYKECYKENAIKPPVTNDQIPFSINSIISYIKDTGLLYSDNLIKRFVFSLMTKHFLILSGLAGSGKTQLALAFANALAENKQKQICVVSVGADWTSREALLGFPNALQTDQYIKPESGVLDLLIEANKTENQNKPYFLILDEMNMSYVERYFTDFLSAMESHEKISLWNNTNENSTNSNNVPTAIGLSNNLFIIGTINVDETTYMFSPKVLDRANVIEFKVSETEMDSFLREIKEINRNNINGKAANMGASFVSLSQTKSLATDSLLAKKYLKLFFTELKKVNAEFGYRSATEIFQFICQAQKNDDCKNKMSDNEILDAAIVQKLLPKLHGSRKKLEPILKKLWELCFDESKRETIIISAENIKNANFKISADKIFRMYESANTNGFTSFAEA